MSSHPRLADVGILELLRQDDRPTFVLGPYPSDQQSQNHVVFRNIALDALLAQCASEPSFEVWSLSLVPGRQKSAQAWYFAGRAWKSTVVGGAWLVVYCAQPEYVNKKRPLDQAASPARDTRVTTQEAPTWDILSPAHSGPAKILDWTRFDVPDLSPHIQLIKNHDWASTPLGPIEAWPDRLSSLVVSICTNVDPRVIIWGEDLIMIYNEACAANLGEKHPQAMGSSAAEVYAEAWPQMATLLRPAIVEGKAVKHTKELSFHERNGILEETYWNFVVFPIIGPKGYAVGAIDSLVELTGHVISQRRREVIEKLNEVLSLSTSVSNIWDRCIHALDPYSEDIPSALIYCNEDDNSSSASSAWMNPSRKYRLEGFLGVDQNNTAVPKSFDLSDTKSVYGLARACKDAFTGRQTVILRRKDNTLSPEFAVPIPGRGWGDPVEAVCVMPITINAYGALAFLIVGLNPRRPFNDDSLQFAHSLRDVIAKSSAQLSQARFEEIHDNLSAQLKISTLKAARNEEKFSKMAESAPIGICTFRPDGKPVYVNDKYLELIGAPREYDWTKLWDTGAAWRGLIHPDDVEGINTAWLTLLKKEKPSVAVEYRALRPWRSVDKATGSEMTGETWLMNNAVAELDDSGNVLYIHAWLLDTSFRHYTETLLSNRLQEALDNKRASENFIDMVSHELRNPLSAILQSADGILSTLDNPETRETNDNDMVDGVLDSAQTIILCAQHQKCIVDDILTLSKLDSNLLVITPDRVRPPHLVERVLKMYDAELSRASVVGKLQIEQSYRDLMSSHDYVMLDPSRLLQVVINLLTNAIKFTQFSSERGLTVYLGASYDKPTGARHNLKFIQPRTVRHEHSTPLSTEWGQGKDIYLQLAVKDTGRGLSEEEISLLFQRFSQASPKTYKQYGGSGLGLFISRELCELQGGQIGVSSKGLGHGTTFAFYVRARRCPREVESVPDSPVALQHVWNTPVTGSTAMPQSDPPPTPSRASSFIKPQTKIAPAAKPTTQAPLSILVVEDNLINQKVMAQQLRKQNCVVHIANHGLEALSFLSASSFSKSASPTPLDIVLMDQEMPVMDGITCVREIRAREKSGEFTSHVPVIAVTANARGEQITVMMQAGMDRVVTKPFRIPELVPQMRALVSKASSPAAEDGEANKTTVAPVNDEAPEEAASAPTETSSELATVDAVEAAHISAVVKDGGWETKSRYDFW